VDHLEPAEDRQHGTVLERCEPHQRRRHRREDPAARWAPYGIAEPDVEVGRVGRVDVDLDPEVGEGTRATGMVGVAVRAHDPAHVGDRPAETGEPALDP
jgi:hypothetical protein